MYIIFLHNCFMHTSNSLEHELPILTNTPNGKRQVQRKTMRVENQVNALTKQQTVTVCVQVFKLQSAFRWLSHRP